jgi:alpha-tubulin suppressor-like RCC1 family protein
MLGTVVATGDNNFGQCNVSSWTDVVAVVCGYYHTVGLKKDGTVVATGDNDQGQCNVSTWKNIVAVSASGRHSVGLKADGTVVATGCNKDNKCSGTKDWRNIAAVFACDYCTLGITTHGKLLCTKKTGVETDPEWTNLVYATMIQNSVVAMTADGRILTAPSLAETLRNEIKAMEKSGLLSWQAKDVLGGLHAATLTMDGSVDMRGYFNTFGIKRWSTVTEYGFHILDNVVHVAPGGRHLVALLADGTVVAGGDNGGKQCNTDDWKLFNSLETLERDRRQAAERMGRGVCIHCGGNFKGLFGKSCASCGRKKDY